MTIKISSTRDVTKQGKSVLVYAESGVGKSTLLGTMGSPTLILNVEGGLYVLKDCTNVDHIEILESLENLAEVFDFLSDPGNISGYQNIALDSATELEKFMQIRLAKKSTNDGMPSMHDYGVISFKMRDYMRRLRDLRDAGKNVVVTCLEMPIELHLDDGEIKTRLYPMMGRKLAPEICGLFDIVARLEISQKPGNEGLRFMRLDGDDRLIAKNRYGNGKFAAANLGAIFACIDEGKDLSDTYKSAAPVESEKPAKKKK